MFHITRLEMWGARSKSQILLATKLVSVHSTKCRGSPPRRYPEVEMALNMKLCLEATGKLGGGSGWNMMKGAPGFLQHLRHTRKVGP